MELLKLTKDSHRSIQDQIEIVLDRMSNEEQIKMLEWISPVQYGKHHKRVEEARTSGTCEWLLQHKKFCEWEEANSSVILWLQGSPGAGKTFLTSKVIDHTRKRLENLPNREGFAFFYCDRNDEERRDPLSVLKSYVRQLSTTVENPDCVRPQLLGLYKKLRQNASELSLDDCAKQLLESRPLKVFISSRRDRDIQSKFLDKPNIEIKATHNEKDIEKFVNEEIINHGGWEDMSANLQSKIVMALLQQSDGMFQWVFLQIKQILNLETEKAILDRIGKLPPDLKTTYDGIYAGIQARHEHDRALADNAFKWVMCAGKPLYSDELLEALRLDSEKDTFELSESITESKLLHLCNNLLVIDSQRKVWRFSHLSVAEYFEKNHWSRPKAHSDSAKVCLKLLIETYNNLNDIPDDSSDDFSDDSSDNLFNVSSDNSSDNSSDDIFHYHHPFHEYALRHWITHTQGQEGEAADPVLTGLLKSFLGSPEESSLLYRRWFHFVDALPSYEVPVNVINIRDISSHLLL
ncbi:hypothetical protein F4823DRAFT_637780 [Ustulina deusta]|nr:hypothetical protein F4823DRAFT_637780 [Ustulina deusta]